MERVIGYKRVCVDVIISRPQTDAGEALPPIKAKRTLMRAIYENLGPHTFCTVDSDISGMRELTTWGSNTDDATGKNKK